MKHALPTVLLLPLAACVSGGAAPKTACSGDSGCLQGSVTVQGFSVTPVRVEANLFREFPATGAVALATTPIAADGTWAFGGLDSWDHYYVEFQADFGQSQDVAGFVGPLEVPSSGAPLTTMLKPAQLTVIEQAAAGAMLQLQSAEAFLFDPSTGAPLAGASVSIEVGGAAVPMPWTSIPGSSTDGYFATFPTPPAAQATYTITSTAPGANAPQTWQLVANAPSFSPSLSAPADGATVPASQPLTVGWPAQPMADEELVELYTQTNGTWSQVYEAPAPLDEDVTSSIIPGSYLAPAGQTLLVNVAFLHGSCPASADGCVVDELIVPAQITPR
ncbi:MAG TPA: hypothetical protein VHS09_14215 [Polyangiaceae bacterium]|jgi:hypothetical protein|nr:hypothetical protein [Polyangiaceae bacterium]